MDWYLKVLKQYTRFNGRARRKEYWYFQLINFLIFLFLTILALLFASLSQQSDSISNGIALIVIIIGLLRTIYSLGVLLPSLAVNIRRLHDIGKSGWWCLIGLVPIVGSLILLYFLVQDSKPGANRFGRNPKESID